MKSRVFEIIAAEQARQNSTVELIASENFVSENVMKAVGSCLTNKYSEGYPAQHPSGNRGRFYGGCQYVDVAENIARDRAKELFHAEHANVQPHSGAQANTAVYFAMLQPKESRLRKRLQAASNRLYDLNFTNSAIKGVRIPRIILKKNYHKAIGILEVALKVDARLIALPSRLFIHTNLALCYFAIGRSRKAAEHLRGLPAVAGLAQHLAVGDHHRVGRQQNVVRSERCGVGLAFEPREEQRHLFGGQGVGVNLLALVFRGRFVGQAAARHQLPPPR